MTNYYLTEDVQHHELKDKKRTTNTHRSKRKKRNKKKYSEREILELMGVYRDQYIRSSGRVKRK